MYTIIYINPQDTKNSGTITTVVYSRYILERKGTMINLNTDNNPFIFETSASFDNNTIVLSQQSLGNPIDDNSDGTRCDRIEITSCTQVDQLIAFLQQHRDQLQP